MFPHKYILFLTYILSAMNRYSGFGNDAPAHMFFFLIIFYFINEIQHIKKTKIFNKILYFSLFTFLIKSFFAIVILFQLSLNNQLIKVDQLNHLPPKKKYFFRTNVPI